MVVFYNSCSKITFSICVPQQKWVKEFQLGSFVTQCRPKERPSFRVMCVERNTRSPFRGATHYIKSCTVWPFNKAAASGPHSCKRQGAASNKLSQGGENVATEMGPAPRRRTWLKFRSLNGIYSLYLCHFGPLVFMA